MKKEDLLVNKQKLNKSNIKRKNTEFICIIYPKNYPFQVILS